jgi:GPH family glycoside/pentoside/hexuronide:cation symporter
MNDKARHETAPEDRIPLKHKRIYGLGAFVNNLLADAIGRMIIVLNLGLGMNPALVGLLGSLPRLMDALTDPLMGYISDNTRSRWGRRRPYIFFGAIAAGVFYIVLWQLPGGKSETFYFWYFLIGSLVFYLGYTMFATPWVALGYEMTPDYDERTRLMGTQNFIGQIVYLISPWFLWVMQHEGLFDNMVDGAANLALVIGVFVIAVGVLPAIFLRERIAPAQTVTSDAADHSQSSAPRQTLAASIGGFFKGFITTLKFTPFLKLCAATFLVFNGFIMIASFQSYVIIYYVFGGDTDMGAKYVGMAGTLGAFSTFIIIPIVTYLGTHLGKRRALSIAIGLSIVGYALKWVCYNPQYPWLVLLPMPLLSFGLGGLFTIMPAMVADVVDYDEVFSHERREGMFGSIFWWVVKLGMAAAIAAGGLLLNATGFDVALEGAQTERTLFLLRVCDVVLPMITSAIAIYAVLSFSINEKRAHEVRAQLEARRGKLGRDASGVTV